MGAVAKAAGVSRPTLYDEFGNKDGLGLALLLLETDRFLAGIYRRLMRNAGDPVKAINSAITFALADSRRSPLLRAVLTTSNHDSDSFLPLLTTRSEPILNRVTEVGSQWWAETFPYADSERVPIVFETLARLVVSHVLLPGPQPRKVPTRITYVATALFADELVLIEKEAKRK